MKISEIPQDDKGELTEGQLQTLVACKWLRRGFASMIGGERLAKWLEEHLDDIESAFGDDDRIYVRTKTRKLSLELAQFVLDQKIGDAVEWKKCKGADRWWLYIWWD